MSWNDQIRRRVIREFVRDNNRAPSVAEILSATRSLRARNVNVENRGLSAIETTLPGFLEASSADAEMDNRRAFADDLEAIRCRLADLGHTLEDDYRSFRMKMARLKSIARFVEGYTDTVLLDIGAEDAFVSSSTETFDAGFTSPNQDNTVSIEGGWCFAGRDSLTAIDLSGAQISFTPVTGAQILNTQPTAPARTILEADGRTYEYIVLVDKQRASVDLVCTITFTEPQTVGEVRISSTNLRTNAPETISAFYSLDGIDYELLAPGARVFDRDRVLIGVGQSDVKSIRLVFNKSVADDRTSTFGQWAYAWQFDAIEVFESTYSVNKKYLFQGEYSMSDSRTGEDRNVNRVSLEVCTIEPEDTGISWEVSPDNTTWHPINPYKKGNDVVRLRTRDTTSLAQVDATQDTGALLNPRNYSAANVIDSNVRILNSYLNSANEGFDAGDVTLLLDVPTFQLDSGWNINNRGNYETAVYIENPLGEVFDLGPAPARLNGRSVSGKTLFPLGWSVFETPTDNYFPIDDGATDEVVMRMIDPLYPFNHKYVIEGYKYASEFDGAKFYQGVDARCGKVVEYQEPEEFDSNNRPWTWTSEYFAGFGEVILVRVNNTQSAIVDATHSFTWTGVAAETANDNDGASRVHVRAILETSSEGLTPMIDWFKIRGI